MQIRYKRNKNFPDAVLCIRTEYRPAHKRTFGKTVATFEYSTSPDTQADYSKLSEDEQKQLLEWYQARKEADKQALKASSVKWAASSLGTALKGIQAALDDDKALAHLLTQDDAVRIYDAMDSIQKALRKLGYKRPPRTVKEPTKAGDLFG